MATFLYGVTSESLAEATLGAWESLDVWGLLVNSSYVPQPNNDQFVSDVPSSAVLARSGPMTNKTTSNGICSGILPQFDSLISSVPAAAIVLYINSGSDSTSQLIYYSADGIGFPLALEGFNYAIAYDQQYGGWFQA
jgi:hypothetical protein